VGGFLETTGVAHRADSSVPFQPKRGERKAFFGGNPCLFVQTTTSKDFFPLAIITLCVILMMMIVSKDDEVVPFGLLYSPLFLLALFALTAGGHR